LRKELAMLTPLLLEMLVQSRLQDHAIAENQLHHLSVPDGSQSTPMLTFARSMELIRRSLAATWCKWWIAVSAVDRTASGN
jgi:hypothetical protein